MIRKTRWSVLVAFVATLFVVVPVGPARAADPAYWPQDGVNYMIVRFPDSSCLDVLDLSVADSARVITWGCWNGPNQQWRFVRTDGIYYEIRARHSDKCLEVGAAAMWSRAPVVQYTCWGGWNQQWAIYRAYGSAFQIMPRHAFAAGYGYCLTPMFITLGPARAVQTTCTYTTSELWTLYPA